MLTSVRISQPVNSLLDSVACTLFIYRWHWFLFDIFDAISVTEIIITIITISGSLKLFIRLNFACQGNPLFDVFIWNIESFMLHLMKTKEFKLSVNPHIFASSLCVLNRKNRYSCKRIEKTVWSIHQTLEMMEKRKFCNKQPFHFPIDCHEKKKPRDSFPL